jgi:hypothetical protein
VQVKTDANLYPLNETVKRVPLRASVSVSIPASSTDSATINVPSNEMWFIKSWTILKGSDVSVSTITVDGIDTYEIASLTDTVARYGALLTVDSTVTISGSNAGIAAESLEIQVDGYKIVF